jgi:ABC-type transport system involved in cytochrome c biogenesis permease component
MNPLLSREIRERWRDGRAFKLVFFFAAGISLLFALIYNSNAVTGSQSVEPIRWAVLGQTLFSYMAWIQTLAWLLITPSLTSSSIAHERERGWFDALILSRLLPRQISLGKWSCALIYAALLYAVTLPCTTLILLLGGVSPAQFGLVMTLHVLCACFGSAVGLAASAWSYRSHVALRSANGLIFMWLCSSFGGAIWSGKTPMARLFSSWGSAVPTFWEWLGRSNPIMCASDIATGAPVQNWPLCFSLLAAGTLFFLWVATYYARRTLEEAPFVEPRKRRKKDASPLQSHGEIPLVTRLKFNNPVLDHEVRSKFRMRQPPLSVIVVEGVLGLLVAGFYLRTLYWAWFEPKYRLNIWYGLVITGLIVTMMSAAVMGANSFSRERERGTWESIQLSLLGPNEILRGKIFASMLTCMLFSLPVLPLLLPCISWGAGVTTGLGQAITPINALACALVWISTAWSYTFAGLWMGRKSNQSARASGQTLGILGAFVVGGPILAFSTLDGEVAASLLGFSNPLFGLGVATINDSPIYSFFCSGIPYFLVHIGFGLILWKFLDDEIAKDMNQREESVLEASLPAA